MLESQYEVRTVLGSSALWTGPGSIWKTDGVRHLVPVTRDEGLGVCGVSTPGLVHFRSALGRGRIRTDDRKSR